MTMVASDNVAREGQRAIEEWCECTKRVDRLDRELNSARVDELNSRNRLAKWMLPDDAKVGEKIGIWHGVSLFEVTKQETGKDAVVVIRSRGKTL